MADSRNPKVDAYIDNAAPFAQPILAHLRALVHKGCPGVEETLKWSRPFFVYKGSILGNMSAFSQHCSFGFWGTEMAAVLGDAAVPGAMGSLGRITARADLPDDKQLIAWIAQARDLIAAGEQQSPMKARRQVVKAQTASPPDFLAALATSPLASSTFDSFSPSQRREYLDWIAEAKRPETRTRRIAQAVEWLAEGKPRHWKYQAR